MAIIRKNQIVLHENLSERDYDLLRRHRQELTRTASAIEQHHVDTQHGPTKEALSKAHDLVNQAWHILFNVQK